ncbi:GAF domain-containing protein [Sulfurimonas sp.]
MKDDKYLKLAYFGRELLAKRSLQEGLPLISKYVKEVINADRCSIFIYEQSTKELWTTLSDGVDKIKVSADKGLVGKTINERKPLQANNAYAHPAFLRDIDKKTGYITHSIITAPIFSSSREIIGVLELLNKEGGFDDEDTKFMIFFAHYISGFIELQNTHTDTKGES